MPSPTRLGSDRLHRRASPRVGVAVARGLSRGDDRAVRGGGRRAGVDPAARAGGLDAASTLSLHLTA